jgi:hypothetical protein
MIPIDVIRTGEFELYSLIMFICFALLLLLILNDLFLKITFSGKELIISRLLFFKKTYQIWHLDKKVRRVSISRTSSYTYIFKYNNKDFTKNVKIYFMGKRFEDKIKKLGFSITI